MKPIARLSLVFLLLSLVVVSAACSDKPDVATGNAASAASASEHAAEGAKPGSHEDWCGEHAVAESQCTQCHSELIAAFKATGDWCAEHGLPESHCRKCNPDLVIQRPPKGS